MRPLLFLAAAAGAWAASALLRRRRAGVARELPAAQLRAAAELREAFPDRALWDRHATSVLIALRENGFPCDDLLQCLAAASVALGRPLAAIDGKEATARLVSEVDAQLARAGKRPPPRPLSADQQRDFAAGIALHDEAVDASQRKDARAHDLVLAALAHLESALGERDPLLVPSLANAARALSDRGLSGSAEKLLLRALELHRARPDADEGETVRLQQLLEHVRAA